MFYVNPRTNSLRRINNENGVLGDLRKLTKILTVRNDENTFGTAIAVYNGSDDTIGFEYIRQRLDENVTNLLNRHVKLIVCANEKCEYVKN